MGRFTSRPASEFPQQQMTPNGQQMPLNPDWPMIFPKPVIGLALQGTIIDDIGDYITSASQVSIIPGVLEAVRMIRLKGYRLVILSNQGGIQSGKQTTAQVDNIFMHIMQEFGKANIFSIDGFYYSTSTMKEDEYVKPNIGMFQRAEREMGVNFKEGWYVGDQILDLKAAIKAGAKPILVKTGRDDVEEKLNTFANKNLKKETKVFNNLLEFAQSLD